MIEMNFRVLPKIELHCHLDGGIRPETVLDIAESEGITLPSWDIGEIRNMVTAPLDCQCLDDYLKSFEIPISVMQTTEALRRVAFELLEDAAGENVKYIEIRFAPVFHMEKGLSFEEVVEGVLEGIRDAENKYDIRGEVILSCLRHKSLESALETVEKGKAFLGRGVVAIDLASSEGEGFVLKFSEAIMLAREYGYRVTIHAGETGIGQNVLEAVEVMGAERIGHGVYIKDCPEAYKLVKEKQIPLEICPTSNLQTKAVDSLSKHPVYDYLKDGIRVTVNTDNRTVSGTDLTGEFEILEREFGFDFEDYKKVYLTSVEAAFVDEKEKKRLRKYI